MWLSPGLQESPRLGMPGPRPWLRGAETKLQVFFRVHSLEKVCRPVSKGMDGYASCWVPEQERLFLDHSREWLDLGHSRHVSMVLNSYITWWIPV